MPVRASSRVGGGEGGEVGAHDFARTTATNESENADRSAIGWRAVRQGMFGAMVEVEASAGGEREREGSTVGVSARSAWGCLGDLITPSARAPA